MVAEGETRLRALRRRRVAGVPVDDLTMRQTLAWVTRHVQSGEPVVHAGVNAANACRAVRDPEYLALLEASDVVGPDGAAVVAAARLLGDSVPERVTGIDLMTAICATAPDRGWRVYLLGARPDVVARLAEKLESEGVAVAGYRDGYLTEVDLDELAEQIAAAGTDILFVGMPTPAKEAFAVEHARPAGIPVTIGVGGSFDVLVGDLRRAPVVLQRLGLEWLFRMLQEPRRLLMRYAVTNAQFIGLVLGELARELIERARQLFDDLREPRSPDRSFGLAYQQDGA
jgi:N-acetylglucosaminyldiphosphoundecaprenol N-acetyl-beta-D-mannosaminyltransferase